MISASEAAPRTKVGKPPSAFCSASKWATYQDAVHALMTMPADVCLLDYRLGARTGIERLQEGARRRDRGAHGRPRLTAAAGDHSRAQSSGRPRHTNAAGGIGERLPVAT